MPERPLSIYYTNYSGNYNLKSSPVPVNTPIINQLFGTEDKYMI